MLLPPESGITPDRWVVVKVETSHGTLKKVFSGNYGGYLGSDDWRLSSEIVEEKEFENRFEFSTKSGSSYICYKPSHGMSGHMSNILGHWRVQGGEVEILDDYKKSSSTP